MKSCYNGDIFEGVYTRVWIIEGSQEVLVGFLCDLYIGKYYMDIMGNGVMGCMLVVIVICLGYN